MKKLTTLQRYPKPNSGARIQKLFRVLGIVLACVLVYQPVRAADEPLAGSSRRPCTGSVTLYLDDTELWDRDSEELTEMKDAVIIPDGKKKKKKGLLLATLIGSAPNIQAVELSTCTGKVRRFEGKKLHTRKDTLYLVITHYRGFRLFNSAGESGRGSRLKNIDRVRLITRPE